MDHRSRNPAPPALTPAQARVLHLAAQGLVHAPRGKATPQALEQAVARMQLLQIDTIHVVARSPYLVLFSRLGGYPAHWLDDLLAAGSLAECWAHEACFVPAVDYSLHCSARPLREGHWAMRRARRAMDEDAAGMRQLLAHVRDHGPVRSADFRRKRRADTGWWDWKPEKHWLEAWFALGELMVARRDGFQRVYDLAERVRMHHPDGGVPVSPEAARERMLARSVRALGIAKASWVGDYFRLARATHGELDALCERGELMRVTVQDWDRSGYVHRDHAALLDKVAAGRVRATHTTLLSPFDPVVWDRRRAREMFGFEYALECYVPAPRRRHGYFVLPILHRGKLVGRLDAKAHRREGVFEVRSLSLEPGVAASDKLATSLARAITRCARWHEAPQVCVRSDAPRAWLTRLRGALVEARQR